MTTSSPGAPFEPDDHTECVVHPSPRLVRHEALPQTQRRVASRRMADAARRIIAALTNTTASAEELNAASERAEEFAVLLETYAGVNQYEAIAQHARTNPRQPFPDFERDEDADPEIWAQFDHSPIIGLANPIAPPARMWHGDGVIDGSVTFGPAYEGPPGYVHGGYVAAVIDELLGITQSLSGSQGMTASLTIDYRSPTPLDEELTLHAWIDRVDGRKIWVKGTVSHGDTLCAQARGLFIALDREKFIGMLAAKNDS